MAAQYDSREASRKYFPPQLPQALVLPKWNPAMRSGRLMTGLEAAEHADRQREKALALTSRPKPLPPLSSNPPLLLSRPPQSITCPPSLGPSESLQTAASIPLAATLTTGRVRRQTEAQKRKAVKAAAAKRAAKEAAEAAATC
ncbi:hypothetical protein V500_03249 [Pseudogymnoascus sp. VKM F-4518 (FW-2643)]|nr:hypothetical protein V500_03249 [Pseudogymnoascus sp. VKM F-4518 (FW-2643)]